MANEPTIVADDMVVSIDYTLTVDGEVIDSTEDSFPLEYIQGHHNIIPGLENELAGMSVGESKEVLVPSKDAYGEIDPNAFTDVSRSQFPEGFELILGRSLRINTTSGHIMTASIAEIGEESVKLDLNHPLAGKELLFNASVVGVRAATEEELASGRVGGGGCSSCGDGCGDGGCGSSCC
jgi:FKBP-type peptidyl-prolyl cis-trans isomerase SlyD